MKEDNLAKVILMIMAGVVTCGWIWSVTWQQYEYNSVPYLARRYGVSKDAVRNLADEYGLDPESLAQYGPQPFPVNYVVHALGWNQDQSEHLTIHRYEIEALVAGYVTRCDIDDTITMYLFYSDSLRSKSLFGFGSEALPLEVTYFLDVTQTGTSRDQVVESISYHSISDSGGWSWEQIPSACDPPAKY